MVTPTRPPYPADTILRMALQAANTVNPLAQEPQELTTPQIKRFLLRNWTEIAAKGYWGYTNQRRGALFLFVRGALPDKIAWDQVTGIYLPAHLVADLSRGSELAPAPTAHKLAEMVAAYDPAQGVVICIANPAWEQWAALQLSNPLLPPPVAYRRAGQQAGVEIG